MHACASLTPSPTSCFSSMGPNSANLASASSIVGIILILLIPTTPFDPIREIGEVLQFLRCIDARHNRAIIRTMDATVWIAFWAVSFLVSHLIISSSAVRPRLIAAVGEQPYRGLYSLVAAGTLGPLIYEFASNKHAGPMLWYLRANPLIRWLTWILMLAALILFVGSFINPNPGGMVPSNKSEPRGVLKITRHPSFVAFGLFGIAHMLMNGTAGDVIFFGIFPALSIIGGMHQDTRKLHELGESYREFMAKTSFTPFAALISGRVGWTSNDTPWAALGVGLVLTVVIVALHPTIFGGNPLG
jgi:uncharacterized membrane protein